MRNHINTMSYKNITVCVCMCVGDPSHPTQGFLLTKSKKAGKLYYCLKQKFMNNFLRDESQKSVEINRGVRVVNLADILPDFCQKKIVIFAE